MHLKPSHPLIAAATLLALSGCSQEEEQQAQAPHLDEPGATETSAMAAQSWLDDFRLGTASEGADAMTQTKEDFAPGEPIHLSMAVEDAPQGTSVVTYWYGPQDQQLGYEIKEVSPDEQRLTFEQDNTSDWQNGEYRAEVWVGDEKVTEQNFQIGAG